MFLLNSIYFFFFYYKNSITDATSYNCILCANPKCSTCPASIYVCTECFGTNRDLTNSCSCPANGFYDGFVGGSISTYDCQPCNDSKCLTCSSTSASTCDVCVDSSRNLPACNCSLGFYDPFVFNETSTYACIACNDTKCQDCSSTSQYVCDVCLGSNRNASNSCACPANGYYDAF